MKLNVNFIKMIKSLLISNKLKPPYPLWWNYQLFFSSFSKNLIEKTHCFAAQKLIFNTRSHHFRKGRVQSPVQHKQENHPSFSYSLGSPNRIIDDWSLKFSFSKNLWGRARSRKSYTCVPHGFYFALRSILIGRSAQTYE